jgi:hypothetical protein
LVKLENIFKNDILIVNNHFNDGVFMKILKKYASVAFLLMLTTMTPLNGNIGDDLLDKEAIRTWCKQYISEEKLNTIETGLIVLSCCLVSAAFVYAANGWVQKKGKLIDRAFQKKNN